MRRCSRFFYIEPVYTEDLGIIFVHVDEEKSKIAPLSPIYTYLVDKNSYLTSIIEVQKYNSVIFQRV